VSPVTMFVTIIISSHVYKKKFDKVDKIYMQ
jgi:thymidylate synthase